VAGDGVTDIQRKTGQAPSRVGRVQLSVHVAMPVRKELRRLAMELDVTLQHLLCQAINDLFEKHGRTRMADEDMLPRGGAAHKGRAS
jgi:antitoxin-like ribbon-helix-helix protein